jgi:hypothetical protein
LERRTRWSWPFRLLQLSSHSAPKTEHLNGFEDWPRLRQRLDILRLNLMFPEAVARRRSQELSPPTRTPPSPQSQPQLDVGPKRNPWPRGYSYASKRASFSNLAGTVATGRTRTSRGSQSRGWPKPSTLACKRACAPPGGGPIGKSNDRYVVECHHCLRAWERTFAAGLGDRLSEGPSRGGLRPLGDGPATVEQVSLDQPFGSLSYAD